MKRISLCCSKTTVFTAAVFTWFFWFLRDSWDWGTLYDHHWSSSCTFFSSLECILQGLLRGLKSCGSVWCFLETRTEEEIFAAGLSDLALCKDGQCLFCSFLALEITVGNFPCVLQIGKMGLCMNLFHEPDNFGNSDLQSKIWYRKRSNGLSWDLLYLTEFQ